MGSMLSARMAPQRRMASGSASSALASLSLAPTASGDEDVPQLAASSPSPPPSADLPSSSPPPPQAASSRATATVAEAGDRQRLRPVRLRRRGGSSPEATAPGSSRLVVDRMGVSLFCSWGGGGGGGR